METSARSDPMRRVNPRKRQAARVLERTGVAEALLRERGRWNPRHIRCLNYHSVAPEWANEFERQLEWFGEHFAPVGPKELAGFHEGYWPHTRPGILLSFDDGCRSHAEVAAPLLERHGFVGWFFLPSRFPDVPVDEQATFASEHSISAMGPDGDPRRALTWKQVRYLDRHHVVGCHTEDHVRLSADLGEEEIRRQIVGAKTRLEEVLGHAVDGFAWVGGEERNYCKTAARLIAETGFRFAFGTNNAVLRPYDDLLRIERTNVEAFYDRSLLYFQLCGVLDVAYAPKRRRLRRELESPTPP